LRAGLTLRQPTRRDAGGDGYNGDRAARRDRLSSGHRFLVARIIARLLMNPASHSGAAPVALPDPATVEQLVHCGTLLFEQSGCGSGMAPTTPSTSSGAGVLRRGLRRGDAAVVYSRQLAALRRGPGAVRATIAGAFRRISASHVVRRT
jgi:hypothetical protein